MRPRHILTGLALATVGALLPGIADAHTPTFTITCQGGLTVSGVGYQGGTVDIVYGTVHQHHTIGSTFAFHVPTPDKTAVEHYVVTIDAADGTTFDHTYQGSVQPCQPVTGSSVVTTTTHPTSTAPPSTRPPSTSTPSTTTQPSTTSTPASTAVPSVSSAPTVATPSSSGSSSPPDGSSSSTSTTPAALSNATGTPTTSATHSSPPPTDLLPATGINWWTFTMAAALVVAAGCAAIRAARRPS